MYIRPIKELLISDDIISANKVRKSKVENIISCKSIVDTAFSKLKLALNLDNVSKVEYVLSYELFFEVIPFECIEELLSVYLNLNNSDSKYSFVDALRGSYIDKGSRGFLFSFMPIINKFSA